MAAAGTLLAVLVELGPVASSSALAWTEFARAVLAGFALRGQRVQDELGDDVVSAFRGYLDAWDEAAARADELRWTGDVDPEQLRYLVHSFHRVAEKLAVAAEERGSRMMRPEAEAFNLALVTALLDALAGAGEPMTAFAEDLRRFWPGLT